MTGLEEHLLFNNKEDNSSFSEHTLITVFNFHFSSVVSKLKKDIELVTLPDQIITCNGT